MREVFRMVDSSLADEEFLTLFQSSGCYLIDLCPEPVDRLEPASRRNACRAAEPSLSAALVQLQPAMIATLVRSIEGNVRQAALRALWSGPFLHLPYPGRWSRHRAAFANALAPVIATLLR